MDPSCCASATPSACQKLQQLLLDLLLNVGSLRVDNARLVISDQPTGLSVSSLFDRLLVARLERLSTSLLLSQLPVEHGDSDSVLALSLKAQLVGECEGMYDPALGQLVSGAAEGLHLGVCGPQRHLKRVHLHTGIDLLCTQSRPADRLRTHQAVA